MIIDPDLAFLDELKSDPKATISPPITANTGKYAQKTLADTDLPLAGVFINPNVTTPEGGPGALSVIRFSYQMRPSIPIYLIFDKECSISRDDYRRLGIHDAIMKPVTYSRMLELVAPELVIFDPKSAEERGKSNSDEVGAETAASDSDFVPIRAADFVSGSVSQFNVYVGLASGRYLKLLHAGEAFSPERLATYLKKGIEYFFLRKEDQQQYLLFCSQIAAKLARNKAVSVEAKIGQTLNHGQETLNFLKSQGLSEANLHHASGFVENIQSAIGGMNLKENDMYRDFMENIAAYEHGVSTAMVTALLSHVSGIESKSITQIVGIASMLHDIGLYTLPPEVQNEDESKMTPQQIALFHTHPSLGAEMLSKIPGTHPSVIQAVLQHHERRGKKGFSAHGRVKTVNRVAEIIGIADDYLVLMKRAKDNPNLNIKSELEFNVFYGFTSPVVEAFRSIFCKSPSGKKKT